MARHPAKQRLTRLLALPAWVAANDGATFEQAASHFGVTPDTIRHDVTTLWVSGLPGGMPGELVDFDATSFEAGRLSLVEPLGLDRPVRLSRQEAASLVLALRVLREVLAEDTRAAEVLASTEKTLSALLASGRGNDGAQEPSTTHTGGLEQGPGPGQGQDQPGDRQAVPAGRSAQVLAAVREALEQRHRLHLVYVSATDTRSERDVDPLELTSDGSHLSLTGWCLSARARRSFRLDRILSATVLPTPVTSHRASRRSRRAASPDEPGAPDAGARPTAVLRLRPSGRWLVEQVPCESVQELDDGTICAVVEGRDQEWLTGLVLSAGAHLVQVEPAGLARDAAQAARRALTAYDDAGLQAD